MEKLVFLVLRLAVHIVKKRFSPFVIAVCGTEGKSLVVRHVAKKLQEMTSFTIVNNTKNTSSPETIPLALFDLFPGRNFSEWLSVCIESMKMALFGKNFPSCWILEMQMEQEGDAEKMLSLLQPDLLVLVNLKPRGWEDEFFLSAITKEWNIFSNSAFRIVANENDARIQEMLKSKKEKSIAMNMENPENFGKNIAQHMVSLRKYTHHS